MEATVHRYIVTQNYPGKHYIITLMFANHKFVKVRYNLCRVHLDYPKLIWKLDKRSTRYIPEIKIIENSMENPKWKC